LGPGLGLCAGQVEWPQVAWQAQTQKASGLSSQAFDLAEEVMLVAGSRIDLDRTVVNLSEENKESRFLQKDHENRSEAEKL
jgi:hypothetical protein